MDLNTLKKLSISKQSPVSESSSTEVHANDIAIIGLNAEIGSAKNVEELWGNLCNGFDLIRDFPEERWGDANRLHQLKFHKPLSEELIPCSYLDRLDQFDAGLFQLSRTEAEVMDPAQRLFLESAWSALEDAGYGGVQLKGSKTGVFLGYRSEYNSYGAMIGAADANTYGVALSGNLDAIIASRISYLLNLKGPAVNIDTSCSSSLVAVHLACQQIRDGEISMALAGSIRLKTVPPVQVDKKMGIESSSARTKTFDDLADGTGAGEGVICIVLKSLRQAIRDRDNIYAVIKGSSINQDGASVGITAPNAEAQEEVIRDAWKNAGINPESISYIEAHGTATNLGDPIEISGIERAFGRFTDKKQFCAVGSVKTNVGHLDCAAGLAGLLKAVLMLKNKKIPPTLHFEVPNRKIDFSSSPVYVNDKLMPWEPGDSPRRCGVSSFGMSGTNCHLVLEEAPMLDGTETSAAPVRVLTASAKNKDTVLHLLKKYQAHLKQFPNCNLADFCYTANIGRGHYNYRFAMVLDSVDDFVNIAFDQSLLDDERCFYHEHKVIDTETQLEGYISSSWKKTLTEQATLLIEQAAGEHDAAAYKFLLQEIVKLYVQGADVPWERLYKKEARHRLSIPTYPYNHKRYWITLPDKKIPLLQKKEKAKLHPLIHQCVLDTHQMQVYETELSIDTCWELKYHKINGVHVLPGTAFIEMAQFVSRRYLKRDRFELQELIYMIPLVCKVDEVRTVHTMAKMEDSVLTITCYSKNEDEHEWTSHLELVVREECEQVDFILHSDEIINRCEQVDRSKKLNTLSFVEVEGDKWKSLKNVYLNDEEVLLYFQINSSLSQEMKEYFLYPSLLDPAINGGGLFMSNVCLPFSCSKARFYEALPEKMYSHIKRKNQGKDTNEFIAFDITLFADDGRVVAELEDYIIKNVHQPEFFMMNQNSQHNMYHATSWVPYEKTYANYLEYQGDNDLLLVLHRPDQESSSLIEQLHHRFGHRLVTVQLAEENDFDSLLSSLPKENIKHIVQMASLVNPVLQSVEDVVSETKLVLKSTFELVKALLNHNVRQEIRLTLMTSKATLVTGDEEQIHPMHRALIGMGASIGEEYANILTRAIDCDGHTDEGSLLEELLHDEPMYAVAYRGNKRYIEQMDTLPYEQLAEQKLELKDQGTYIITGGLGGMGLALCRYLFSVNPEIHVILLNRTYSREAFEALTAHDDVLLQNKIDQVNKLWTEGKNLDILQVDIAEYDQIKATLQDIRDRNGAIDGVIHAAGVAGDGFILTKDWETFEEVLSPKIYGTWVLHELTRDDQLDFFVMCSSLTSVFGTAGQSDYIAANAYMDSFTYYRRNQGVPSLTINWTGWSESGMAVSNGVNVNGMYVHFVKDTEGANAFAHALQTGLPRVLVGEINYSVLASGGQTYAKKIRLSEKMTEKQGATAKVITPTANRDIQNVVVTGKSMDKLTEIEKNVIAAWVQTLGVDEVDVHDKFFESGGNSLLASYLHKEMNKVYPGMTAITDIFVYSSVVEISSHIESKMGPSAEKLVIEEDDNKQNEEDLEKLVEQFASGDMDLNQMLALLIDEKN
ncbi:phosphopantetheine attachment protein [Lysinibacillus sp. FJAT-14745]|uniref:SDR family NAD(P)-dependent oxidoreductase n=1 Tax=Lysinibacillus sp. FJAT-14745 TaxID=1704289 RepID=UPI0006ABA78F|nr:SDR family NAD(P)-dependent oxidoreductase [Lysinibacillus sp. FJAT-14745]KOP78299.1 phosphopantetheine attachment protein [Lysinibacillus sp. FJAT-14745]